MACKEARAMLDALMGSDRNAPLPKGAAIPGNYGKKRNNQDNYQQTLKRKKSCYDKDIDPIYTAWGVDVYDLFINTKSDIGMNPYVVDKNAHEEYKQLSMYEKEKLGYEYILFHKLQDLVRQGDRMIARNKEKLKQELQRKLSQRNYQDFVQDVDRSAVEQLTRDMVLLEDFVSDYESKLQELGKITTIEDARKNELELLLSKAQEDLRLAEALPSSNDTHIKNEHDDDQNVAPKVPPDFMMAIKEDPDTALPEYDAQTENNNKDNVNSNMDTTPKDEPKQEDHHKSLLDDKEFKSRMKILQTELGQITLQKQRLVYDIAQLMIQIVPQNDTVESQRRHLNYVKSDISTDKTVCEISGNNMSSRDADERIAAHYSGKQYIGWKLVRDKLQSMIQQYGRNGPLKPSQPSLGPSPTNNLCRPPMNQQTSYGSGGSNSTRGGRPPSGVGGFGGSSRDSYSDRGGGGGGGYGGRSGSGGGRDNWSRSGGGLSGPRGGGGDVYNHDRQRYPPSSDRGWRR